MNLNKEQQFGEGLEIWKAARKKMVGGLTLQPHEVSGKRKDAIGWSRLVLMPDVGCFGVRILLFSSILKIGNRFLVMV